MTPRLASPGAKKMLQTSQYYGCFRKWNMKITPPFSLFSLFSLPLAIFIRF
jgi:hypothetical protein